MYGMRIPNNTMVGDLTNAVEEGRDAYSRLQIQIASGNKYLNRSDNPIETNEAASINNSNLRLEQWGKNVVTADSWEKATDATLQNILGSLQRANELVVQSNDGAMAMAKSSIAMEVDSIIESLTQSANSQYTGQYMFAGQGGTGMTGNDPFLVTRDAAGKITAVTYQGGTERKNAQISDTGTSEYGLVGEGSASPSAKQDIGIFKFTSLEDDGSGTFVNQEVHTFDELIKWRDKLESGDTTDWDQTLSRVQGGLEQVVNKVIDNASSQQKFQSLGKNVAALSTSQINRLSDLEDLDMTAAITELTSMQSNLQASLQMITRMNAMSIVNFI